MKKFCLPQLIVFILFLQLNGWSQPWKELDDSANYYVSIGQYAKAVPFFDSSRILAERMKGKQSAEYASTANNLGWTYRLNGKYDKAEIYLVEARDIREKLFGKENADYATSCNRLAVLYADVGQYDDALPLYTEAMQIREKVLGKEHMDYAMSCNNMGVFYTLTGNLMAAEPYHLEAKRIREKLVGKLNPFYAASLNNLGVLYLNLGQYRKAETYYREAKQIRGEIYGKEHPEYAASCDNLAVLLMDMGNYEEAELLYNEGKQIREKTLGTSHPNFAWSCNNLGLLYRNLGQFEKSKTFFISATEVLSATLGKQHPEYAKTCNNLGALYMDMGAYDKATVLYEEARQVWEKVLGKQHPEYAKSLNNLALMHYFKGELDRAATLLEETNELRAKTIGTEHPDYAASSDNLGVVYTELRNFEKALTCHTRALEIRKKTLGTGHADYLQSCINNATMYWNMGRHQKAGELYVAAFESSKIQIEKVFRFTTEPEKFSYLKKTDDFKNYFLSYSMTKGATTTPAYTLGVSQANRNLTLSSASQLRASIYQANDTQLLAKYNSWMELREQLAFWYAKPITARKETVEELENKAALLEKDLARSSDMFRKQQEVFSWENIRQQLRPGEAAVEYTSYRYYNGRRWTDSIYYIATIVRKEEIMPVIVPLFEQKELDAILNYRGTSPGQARVNYLYSKKANRQDLYDLVWKPLEQKLVGIRTIYFSPAASLYKISFAALPVNAREVLSDQYKLVQLNSTALAGSLAPGSAISHSDAIALFGGVQYNADSLTMWQAAAEGANKDFVSRSLPADISREGVAEFNYLDGTEKEVNEIGSLAKQKNFKAMVLSGTRATEEAFKRLNGTNSPAILHIATHGFFFPDPKQGPKDERSSGFIVFRQSDDPLIRSGLALAGANNAWKGKAVSGIEDGILTSFEVNSMYLPSTRLAVLSACETGLGDIQGSEGVYGLQRAFKIAGAENLVMSLWKVPDTETAAFMQEFYKNIFAQMDIATAFFEAQKSLRSKYGKDIYKWGAWVLVR